ncbi:MAG: RNase H-like domain-containing protein, partial [Candidatus Thiodiazotropha endolucinida]|nr:RNase H-like domain-containing protein [Candidatus Thiodiazotropha endolucinida]
VGLQWNILVLYLDDIIVFSKTFDEHMAHLETVFERLEQSGLKLKAKKCYFFSKEVTFLGHTVSENGIKPDFSKIEAVKCIHRPTNVTELRKFLGFTSYFRKFVKDYATIAKPLYNLTKKTVSWKWEPECEKSFQTLKEKLVSYPVLAYPDINGGQFILDCDASDYGIGAVLSQVQNGDER